MRASKAIPAALERGRRKFEQWRETRESQRSRIPESLWKLASQLAEVHGNHRTARTLRLNPDALKKRTERVPVPRRTDAQSSPTFVEVMPMETGPVREYLVELEDSSGARMKIHVKGDGAPDLASLASGFWKGGDA